MAKPLVWILRSTADGSQKNLLASEKDSLIDSEGFSVQTAAAAAARMNGAIEEERAVKMAGHWVGGWVIHTERGPQGDDTSPTVEALELKTKSPQITEKGLSKEKDL